MYSASVDSMSLPMGLIAFVSAVRLPSGRIPAGAILSQGALACGASSRALSIYGPCGSGLNRPVIPLGVPLVGASMCAPGPSLLGLGGKFFFLALLPFIFHAWFKTCVKFASSGFPPA